MNEGSLVVVTGKLDTRVREKAVDGLVIGTLYFKDEVNKKAWVILPDFDLWYGGLYEVAPYAEQIK